MRVRFWLWRQNTRSLLNVRQEKIGYLRDDHQQELSKHVMHSFGSHTEKAIKKDTTAIEQKLKLQNTITRSEYKYQLAHLNQSLSSLLDMVEALSKNFCENTRKISLYKKNITKIEVLICILHRKTVIADPGPAAADGTTNSTIPTSTTNSTTSSNSTNPTESTTTAG